MAGPPYGQILGCLSLGPDQGQGDTGILAEVRLEPRHYTPPRLLALDYLPKQASNPDTVA